jgi:hypothetical protein
MQIDVARKETSRSAERDMRLYRMFEILARDKIQLATDPCTQRVGQFDLFA